MKRLVIHIDDTSHTRLKVKTAQEGTNMTALIRGLIEDYLSKPAKEPGVKVEPDPEVKVKRSPPAKGRWKTRQQQVDSILHKATKP